MTAQTTMKMLGVLVCLLVMMLPGRAAVWTLANGDRLTAELVKEDATHVEVLHPRLGLLKIPRADLLAMVAAQPTAADVRKDTPSAQPAGTAVKPKLPKWKRQLEFGYAQQAGAREKQDLSMRMQLDGKRGENTYRATARLLQTETDNLTVADRREAEFRWRYDINKRLFTQALTTYVEDGVRNIDLSVEQQLGGGYRIVDGDRHKANVGVGAVAQYLDRVNAEAQTALLGSFFQDYAYEMNSRLKLTQESSFMYSDTGALTTRSGAMVSAPTAGSYRLKFNTGMQSKVTDHMSLNVRFEYDYDRSILDSELRADQRLTTSLGYIW
jgi:putative salt-induced outer membrane protein YdiY